MKDEMMKIGECLVRLPEIRMINKTTLKSGSIFSRRCAPAIEIIMCCGITRTTTYHSQEDRDSDFSRAVGLLDPFPG